MQKPKSKQIQNISKHIKFINKTNQNMPKYKNSKQIKTKQKAIIYIWKYTKQKRKIIYFFNKTKQNKSQ